MSGGPPLRVAVVARAVMPLHGFGGLERSVHDLVRHLAARDVDVTLIVPPAAPLRRSMTDPFASPRHDRGPPIGPALLSGNGQIVAFCPCMD